MFNIAYFRKPRFHFLGVELQSYFSAPIKYCSELLVSFCWYSPSIGKSSTIISTGSPSRNFPLTSVDIDPMNVECWELCAFIINSQLLVLTACIKGNETFSTWKSVSKFLLPRNHWIVWYLKLVLFEVPWINTNSKIFVWWWRVLLFYFSFVNY